MYVVFMQGFFQVLCLQALCEQPSRQILANQYSQGKNKTGNLNKYGTIQLYTLTVPFRKVLNIKSFLPHLQIDIIFS